MAIHQPYLIRKKTIEIREYNPDYGDDRTCECGHSYYRHFDPFEYMQAVGCKYCSCYTFQEAVVVEVE